MASFNLLRNSRVFYTTNVNTTTGVVQPTGFLPANTQELQVLDGFSFSQSTNADTVTVSEAGNTPVRGQRSFNTSLSNVEFSFSTYIKPYLSGTVKAEESMLWNSLFSNTPTTATALPTTGYTFAYSAGVLTITGTSIPVTLGEVIVLKGIAGAGASQYNAAAKVTTITGTTSIQVTYLVTPAATWVTGNFVAGTVTLNRTAWNEYPAVALDLASTTGGGIPTAYSAVTSATSNRNQLVPFGMLIVVDGVTYQIDNCVMDQAVVDFGLDGIATVAWTGKGTKLSQLAANITTPTAGTFATGVTGTYGQKVINTNYITNKLSTVTLDTNIGGGGTSYIVPLTGGSITIANNVTYVTPANIGTVNLPIGYFTGTRSITGTLNAYLRTGSTNTGGLLNTLLAAINAGSATAAETKYRIQIEVGGLTSPIRVEFDMDGALLQIPTIDAQAVMSTVISFTAQGTDPVFGASANYDLENTNDIQIRYFSN